MGKSLRGEWGYPHFTKNVDIQGHRNVGIEKRGG
jgi:hypothetical protein